MDVDLAVLGSGPGGYPAAIRASQLGLSVAVVEQGAIGGTCLNVGCIPTKAMVQTAHGIRDATEHFAQLGINVSAPEIDFGQVQKNKDEIVKKLVGGVAGLLKANGIAVVAGRGRFTDPHTIEVEGAESVTFKHAIIASGSSPLRPPVEGIDNERCVDSTGLLAVTEIPKRLTVIGGGVIGCEFASIFSRLGTEVTIVEFLDHIIPMADQDCIRGLERAFKQRGITVHVSAKATQVEDVEGGVRLTFEKGGEAQSVESDLILVSTGRGPNTADLGLETIGVEFDPKKGIAADETRKTTVDHIYAVGDCAGYWQLAHTAFREGEVAAENVAGHPAVVSGPVPSCIYTEPEVAGVGLTQAQAEERYGAENLQIGVAPFAAIARAAMHGDKIGFVKTIAETKYGELVGVHTFGTDATELINGGLVGISAESTIDTIADGMAAHPTLAEALKEAALVALERPIHLPPKRKRAASGTR